MDHQKPTILLIFGTLSLGGCGGHPMRPKLNLKVKSQMSKPNEYTDNIKSNLTCTFLSVRYKLKNPFCPRTLCTSRRFFVCCVIDKLSSSISNRKHASKSKGEPIAHYRSKTSK